MCLKEEKEENGKSTRYETFLLLSHKSADNIVPLSMLSNRTCSTRPFFFVTPYTGAHSTNSQYVVGKP